MNIESHTVNSYDLFNLSEDDKNELIRRVKTWNGIIRIFVHPMYEKWRGHETKYVRDPKCIKLVQIEQILSKLVGRSQNSTPPIIIMEERTYADYLALWLEEHSSQCTYFINTHDNNPTPDISKLTGELAWQPFINLLQEIGVRKIVLGGMQFIVDKHEQDWTGKGPWVAKCVGIALSYLSDMKAGPFRVELSALINPINERHSYQNYIRMD